MPIRFAFFVIVPEKYVEIQKKYENIPCLFVCVSVAVTSIQAD